MRIALKGCHVCNYILFELCYINALICNTKKTGAILQAHKITFSKFYDMWGLLKTEMDINVPSLINSKMFSYIIDYNMSIRRYIITRLVELSLKTKVFEYFFFVHSDFHLTDSTEKNTILTFRITVILYLRIP